MYQYGHSDGYTHTFGSPFYLTFADANRAGIEKYGPYAVTPRPREALVLNSGKVYLVEGPYLMASAVEDEEKRRHKALAKLTAEERKLLGLEK